MEPTSTPTAALYGTRIEGRLAEDREGVLRKQLCAELARARRSIDAQLRAPQTPEAFARLMAMRELCLAGTRTVDKVWRRLAAQRA
ncbi:EscE/YscE/SsaE family type III secretion system needle protein co-chaperone [Cupriavidus sp. H18C1]|uniref:EscE/YscE/SsaE family type III secretion system needle protein co-chaperone n=1 Tax=Cupriavidus sp. H18C1 TaxID=3241601 RepID=UPI003BB91ED5